MSQTFLKYQDKMKAMFDTKAKDRVFQLRDIMLEWDVKREDKVKHGKFYPLWFGPFKVVETKGKNTFLLENIDGEVLELPVNGKYLKHYFQ